MRKAKDRNSQQLVIEIPIEIYKEVKKAAIDRGITLRVYTIRALLEFLEKYDQVRIE